MQTSNRLRRLLRELESEPLRTCAVLAKCGGGLAVIVLIAVIGAATTDTREATLLAKKVAPRVEKPAQEHRKQVFDERRARFADGASRHYITSDVIEKVNLLPFALR